jgi:hypothetical protein
MWCDPCNRQTAEYGETFQRLAGNGGVLSNHLHGSEGRSDGGELKAWEGLYSSPLLAMDDQRLTKEDFPQPHPTALLIDTTTMKVVYRLVGFTPAAELVALIEGHL